MKSKKQKLKDKAWKLFSEWIRRRDADLDGYVSCVTCKKRAQWKGDGMQAGHFISGRTLSLLFDHRNCHTQCYGCNVGRNGSYVEYFIYMEERYGRKVIDELRRLKYQSKKYGIGDYERLIEELERSIRLLEEV
jgi:hypothetical protein